EESSLLGRLRAADLALRRTDEPNARARFTAELEGIHDRLNCVWHEMSKIPDAARYVKSRRGEPLRWEEVQAWLAQQPSPSVLVEFAELSNRWVAFIVRPGEEEPRIAELDLAQSDLLRLVTSWTEALHDARTSGQAAAEELGSRLLAPVIPHLAGFS